MRWPWTPRPAALAAPPPSAAEALPDPAPPGPAVSPRGWAFLPPLQRTLGATPSISQPLTFPDRLAARANPTTLTSMGHLVSEGGPGGVIDALGLGIAADAAHPARMPSSDPSELVLALDPPAPATATPVQRSASTASLVRHSSRPVGLPTLATTTVPDAVPPTPVEAATPVEALAPARADDVTGLSGTADLTVAGLAVPPPLDVPGAPAPPATRAADTEPPVVARVQREAATAPALPSPTNLTRATAASETAVPESAVPDATASDVVVTQPVAAASSPPLPVAPTVPPVGSAGVVQRDVEADQGRFADPDPVLPVGAVREETATVVPILAATVTPPDATPVETPTQSHRLGLGPPLRGSGRDEPPPLTTVSRVPAAPEPATPAVVTPPQVSAPSGSAPVQRLTEARAPASAPTVAGSTNAPADLAPGPAGARADAGLVAVPAPPPVPAAPLPVERSVDTGGSVDVDQPVAQPQTAAEQVAEQVGAAPDAAVDVVPAPMPTEWAPAPLPVERSVAVPDAAPGSAQDERPPAPGSAPHAPVAREGVPTAQRTPSADPAPPHLVAVPVAVDPAEVSVTAPVWSGDLVVAGGPDRHDHPERPEGPAAVNVGPATTFTAAALAPGLRHEPTSLQRSAAGPTSAAHPVRQVVRARPRAPIDPGVVPSPAGTASPGGSAPSDHAPTPAAAPGPTPAGLALQLLAETSQPRATAHSPGEAAYGLTRSRPAAPQPAALQTVSPRPVATQPSGTAPTVQRVGESTSTNPLRRFMNWLFEPSAPSSSASTAPASSSSAGPSTLEVGPVASSVPTLEIGPVASSVPTVEELPLGAGPGAADLTTDLTTARAASSSPVASAASAAGASAAAGTGASHSIGAVTTSVPATGSTAADLVAPAEPVLDHRSTTTDSPGGGDQGEAEAAIVDVDLLARRLTEPILRQLRHDVLRGRERLGQRADL